jgi:hypothetical protein
MFEFDELRELAADVRVFINLADDKAAALRNIIDAYDVVIGIFPSGDEMGLYVIKGRQIIENFARSKSSATYAHTAIAVPDKVHAELLAELTAQRTVAKLAA